MSDDELDYMSDTFLAGGAVNDIRPGLLHSHKQKRDHDQWKKKGKQEEKRPPKRATLESEARTDGLLKPISSDNKGFAMLAKMGFNPGDGLGRDGQGRTEPIGIDVKTDKQGLGRKAAVAAVTERKKKLLAQRKSQNTVSIDDFRASLRGKAEERQAQCDLMKSQRVCYNMDKECGVDIANEPWFWPEFAHEPPNESDEEETDDQPEPELTTKEKLDLITYYLRTSYFYCVWCGVKYDNSDDLRDCPGSTRDDHDV